MQNDQPIYLASSSPRRKELLEEGGWSFTTMSPNVDEVRWPKEMPASYTLRLSFEKASAVAENLNDPAFTVIAADTVVVKDDRVLEKPNDKQDAFQMLKMLSGEWHHVITGICVIRQAERKRTITGDAVHTHVWFRPLTDEEIWAYIETGEPMDKAGAYAIQGGAAEMVNEIKGSWTNVVGLPMERLKMLLM